MFPRVTPLEAKAAGLPSPLAVKLQHRPAGLGVVHHRRRIVFATHIPQFRWSAGFTLHGAWTWEAGTVLSSGKYCRMNFPFRGRTCRTESRGLEIRK